MKIRDLHYNTFVCDSQDVSRMIDLLLAKVIGRDSFRSIRNKSTGTIEFKFWSDKPTFYELQKVIEKEVNHWDNEYKELLQDA